MHTSGMEAGAYGRLMGMEAAGPSYHAEDDYLAVAKPHEGIDLLKMFPSAFAMTCGLLFVMPSWIILRIGRTPILAYFTSNWYLVVLIVPAVLIWGYLVHVRRGSPRKAVVGASLLLPSILLMLCAHSQYLMSVNNFDKLFSADCDTFKQKRDLQSSWEAAYNLYMSCLHETSRTQGYSLDLLKAKFRIQDCTEYKPDALGYAQDWEYLRKLEEELSCAGWCYHGEQLWAFTGSKDSCSAGVAQYMQSYVQPHSSKVAFLMLGSLVASAVGLVLIGHRLRKNGWDW